MTSHSLGLVLNSKVTAGLEIPPQVWKERKWSLTNLKSASAGVVWKAQICAAEPEMTLWSRCKLNVQTTRVKSTSLFVFFQIQSGRKGFSFLSYDSLSAAGIVSHATGLKIFHCCLPSYRTTRPEQIDADRQFFFSLTDRSWILTNNDTFLFGRSVWELESWSWMSSTVGTKKSLGQTFKRDLSLPRLRLPSWPLTPC